MNIVMVIGAVSAFLHLLLTLAGTAANIREAKKRGTGGVE